MITLSIFNKKQEIVAHAVVDDCDSWARSFRWHKSGKYPATTIDGKSVRLHTLIVNPSEGFVTDHIDGDPMNNRRDNLREITQAENCQNVRTRKGDMRGVYFAKAQNNWYGQVKHMGKRYCIGRFDTPEECRDAVQKLRKEILSHA